MSLDTLANVKARLGVTDSADDSLLTLLQGSADQFVANYCDRVFEGGSFTEYHPGGSEFVHLRNYPVAGLNPTGHAAPSRAVGRGSDQAPLEVPVVHSHEGIAPVAFGEQDVACLQPAPFAVSFQHRKLTFIERWKNLMVAAAAGHQVFTSA